MKRCRTAVRLNREADDGGGWYFTPSEGAAKGSKHLISSVWKDPFPEKVHHKNTLVYVSDVTTGGDKGKENRTYRVNSSVNWVWSGGKNFTTNRRMVFLGPEGRNEHLSITTFDVVSTQIPACVMRPTADRVAFLPMITGSGIHLRLICFSAGFSRSSHT